MRWTTMASAASVLAALLIALTWAFAYQAGQDSVEPVVETVEVPVIETVVETVVETVEVPAKVVNHPIDTDMQAIIPGETWGGELVGTVVICPRGFELAHDVTPDGTIWGACM